MIDWDSKPDFVNETGIKWWLDKESTRYAKSKLKDASVWYTYHPDGTKTRVLIVDKEVVYENTSIEGIACYIDILAIK